MSTKPVLDMWEVTLLKLFCDHLTKTFDNQKVWNSFDRFLEDYQVVKQEEADEVFGDKEAKVDG